MTLVQSVGKRMSIAKNPLDTKGLFPLSLKTTATNLPNYCPCTNNTNNNATCDEGRGRRAQTRWMQSTPLAGQRNIYNDSTSFRQRLNPYNNTTVDHLETYLRASNYRV